MMNTMNPPTQPLVKKKVLAATLGVSVRTVDTWVAQRVIPYLATSPRLHLFDSEEVRTALTARFGVQPRPTSTH
jgi:phage terminase Nu1 subunit (DNA packaging protein)